MSTFIFKSLLSFALSVACLSHRRAAFCTLAYTSASLSSFLTARRLTKSDTAFQKGSNVPDWGRCCSTPFSIWVWIFALNPPCYFFWEDPVVIAAIAAYSFFLYNVLKALSCPVPPRNLFRVIYRSQIYPGLRACAFAVQRSCEKVWSCSPNFKVWRDRCCGVPCLLLRNKLRCSSHPFSHSF